jgi:hypothetical protein
MDKEREEYLRRERVAVGRICQCGKCVCCEELTKDREARAHRPFCYKLDHLTEETKR